LRILHIVHQYLPEHIGGTELYTYNLARQQVETGHQVGVFYPSSLPDDDERPGSTSDQGVDIHRVPLGPRGRGRVFRDTFYNPAAGRALSAVLGQEQPDIVHIQHLMGLPAAGLARIVREQAVPYVITLHDYWFGCANGQLITNDSDTICQGPDRLHINCGRCALARAGLSRASWLAPAAAPLMAYRNRRLGQVWQAAGRVIAPTHFVKSIYEQMGLPAGNMMVISHGIEVPQEKIKAILAHRPANPPDRLHIGYVGSLGWQKGVHHLIRAVNQLPPDRVRLSIYGQLDTFPDYVARLRDLIHHPGIHLAGALSRDDLWPALAGLDVAVLPTLWYEASPLTIQELFAVGVPVIASRIGAMSEKIRDGVDGLLFPPGDEQALAALLLRLLDEPELRERLRAEIRPVKTVVDQAVEIEAVYRAVCLETVENGPN
jgi:glycosyltransferase involved in cell wall biosynthesis